VSSEAMVGIARFVWSHPICRKGRLRAFARVAYWQVRSRLQEDVVVPWIGGQRLIVRRGMTGVTGNIYAGLHEFADMALVLHFLRPDDDLFFDIGANVGSYTVLASGVCKARAWAFEPDPVTAAHLGRNIALNTLQNCVTVHQIALGATEADVPFTIGQDTVNKVARSEDPNVRMVHQVPLDALARENVPSMIKMDIEGYEPEVIKGAARMLRDSRLKVIQSETVTVEMEQALTQTGFERMQYDPFSRQLTPSDSMGTAASNILFVRDDVFTRKRLVSANKVTVFNVSL
jgi:FkbM family methyltransferase